MVGDKIIVCYSKELEGLKLKCLVNHVGEIVEERTGEDQKFKGCFTIFREPYLEQEEWFIPSQSLKLL